MKAAHGPRANCQGASEMGCERQGGGEYFWGQLGRPAFWFQSFPWLALRDGLLWESG